MKRFKFKKISVILLNFIVIISLFHIAKPVQASDFSSKYDPRELNLMTSVKSQGIGIGSCFVFAGIGALESYLKVNGYGDYDLSEEHARWWATLNDEGYGWNRGANDGGPTQIMPGYLTSFTGVKLESVVPYQSYSFASKPANMDASGVYNVSDLVYLDNNRDTIKDAILKYGAVATTEYYSKKFLNYSTSAYAVTDDTGLTANHNVIIVGWDDNYSKDNFIDEFKPQNDGAWLVKDSYGAYDSEGGYEWVSYEDKFILKTDLNKLNYAIKGVQAIDNNTKVYQYDDNGSITNLVLNVNDEKAKKMVYANVFDFSKEYEKLHSVMINTRSVGANYSLYYAKVEDGIPVISDDTMTLLKTGIVQDAGYMTFDVGDYILPEGKGAIVLVLDGTQNNVVASVGCEANLYYAGDVKAYNAKANVGESFIYSENEIMDVNQVFTDSPRNLSIKAITEKSNDTSLSSIKINNNEYISYLNGDTVDVELSNVYKGSKINFSVIANNKYSTISSSSSMESISIPKNGVIDPINVTCTAPDGSVKNYKINISLSDNVSTANDINNYINGMDKSSIDDIISLNKCYDTLSSDEKAKLSADVVSQILSTRNQLEADFHEDKGITINNLDWQIETQITQLDENNQKWINAEKQLENKKIFSLYDVSLYDHYTNLDYHLNGKEVQVIIPMPDVSGYKDIKVIHENKSGGVDIITPQIQDGNLVFNINSFSAIGIIGVKDVKVDTVSNDNSSTKVTIANEPSTIQKQTNSPVKTGDKSSNTTFVIAGIASLVVVVFMGIDFIKKRKR